MLEALRNPFVSADEMPRNTLIEATFNVSLYGETCRVRATFQLKTFDRKGRVSKIRQIDSQKFCPTSSLS